MALSQAKDTNQALASGVIVGSLPGRGRSSSVPRSGGVFSPLSMPIPFWVDAYFEETQQPISTKAMRQKIKLMGYGPIIRREVADVARAINVPNAQPNDQGLASVNPIFTWVRLARRVPVRVRIDEVPRGVRLVAGMTATPGAGRCSTRTSPRLIFLLASRAGGH